MDLTRSRAKAAAYAADTYFREGRTVWCGHEAALWRTGLAVLKPDAVVGRRLVRAVDALADAGFRVVAAETHHFTRHSVRELWRFQLNQATADRLAVVDRLLRATPSLVLLLADVAPLPGVPAAVRLSSTKGSADSAARRPGDLRSRLGAGPTLYNFLHTADEPADVVRETCVLFDDAVLAHLAAAAAAGRDDTVRGRERAAELERSVAAHDLDFAMSVDRLLAACTAAGADEAVAAVRRVARRSGHWTDVARRVAQGRIPHDAWDVTTVAVHTVEQNLSGVAPLVGQVGLAAWQRSSEGTRVLA